MSASHQLLQQQQQQQQQQQRPPSSSPSSFGINLSSDEDDDNDSEVQRQKLTEFIESFDSSFFSPLHMMMDNDEELPPPPPPTTLTTSLIGEEEEEDRSMLEIIEAAKTATMPNNNLLTSKNAHGNILLPPPPPPSSSVNNIGKPKMMMTGLGKNMKSIKKLLSPPPPQPDSGNESSGSSSSSNSSGDDGSNNSSSSSSSSSNSSGDGSDDNSNGGSDDSSVKRRRRRRQRRRRRHHSHNRRHRHNRTESENSEEEEDDDDEEKKKNKKKNVSKKHKKTKKNNVSKKKDEKRRDGKKRKREQSSSKDERIVKKIKVEDKSSSSSNNNSNNSSSSVVKDDKQQQQQQLNNNKKKKKNDDDYKEDIHFTDDGDDDDDDYEDENKPEHDEDDEDNNTNNNNEEEEEENGEDDEEEENGEEEQYDEKPTIDYKIEVDGDDEKKIILVLGKSKNNDDNYPIPKFHIQFTCDGKKSYVLEYNSDYIYNDLNNVSFNGDSCLKEFITSESANHADADEIPIRIDIHNRSRMQDIANGIFFIHNFIENMRVSKTLKYQVPSRNRKLLQSAIDTVIKYKENEDISIGTWKEYCIQSAKNLENEKKMKKRLEEEFGGTTLKKILDKIFVDKNGIDKKSYPMTIQMLNTYFPLAPHGEEKSSSSISSSSSIDGEKQFKIFSEILSFIKASQLNSQACTNTTTSSSHDEDYINHISIQCRGKDISVFLKGRNHKCNANTSFTLEWLDSINEYEIILSLMCKEILNNLINSSTLIQSDKFYISITDHSLINKATNTTPPMNKISREEDYNERLKPHRNMINSYLSKEDYYNNKMVEEEKHQSSLFLILPFTKCAQELLNEKCNNNNSFTIGSQCGSQKGYIFTVLKPNNN